MEALVGFEAVSTVPVAAAFDERFGSVDVLFYAEAVAEEDADAYDGEDEIDFRAEDAGFFEDGFVGGESFVL